MPLTDVTIKKARPGSKPVKLAVHKWHMLEAWRFLMFADTE